MKIIILNSSDVPIYEQIKEQIKAAVFSGKIKEGEMLPSIRQLARDLKISVITTSRAYTDLEKEGYIANVQGKGCFVQPKNKDVMRERVLSEIENNFYNAVTLAKNMEIPKTELLEIFAIIAKEEDYE